MSLYGLSPRGVQRATETARRVLGHSPSTAGSRRGNYGHSDERYQGQLTSDLEPGSFEEPTTATMLVWFPDPSSAGDPPAFAESDLAEITVVNRDPSLSAATGVYIKVELINGEWSPYWVGCE